MLEFDKKSNLLMTNRYQYSLQDVAEPNLYRELYDYESIPKVAFNMRHVPENMPDEIWMTDTTFRDGRADCPPVFADAPFGRPEGIDSPVRILSVHR